MQTGGMIPLIHGPPACCPAFVVAVAALSMLYSLLCVECYRAANLPAIIDGADADCPVSPMLSEP